MDRPVSRAVLLASLALVLPACGATVAPRSVRVAAQAGLAHDLATVAIAEPLDPRVVVALADVPDERTPEVPSDAEARLARARSAYVDTLDFDACRAELAEPQLVVDALARGDRALAGRLLFWRAACDLAAGDAASAAESAARIASAHLRVPEGADLASPRVEAMIQDAVTQRDEDARATVSFTSEPTGAEIAIDGESAACATPCELALLSGEHVVHAALDGRIAESERVVLAAGSTTAWHAALAEAPPDVALAQWSARYARSGDVDSWPSLDLLGLALRTRELVFVSASQVDETLLLRAALTVDDVRPLRAERRVDLADGRAGMRALLLDLFREGGITPPTPLYEEPLFWIAVVSAAAIAAGISFGLAYQPGVDTTLVLRRPE
jgi:hypothetical protein